MESETCNVGDLPLELVHQPQSYVAFVGLEVGVNPVHNSIWDSFNLNRRNNDKSPLCLKLLKDGHEFPSKKLKNASFEWHVPKGLLKVNWLQKHLSHLPAVAVLFYDLDWDDSQWADKMLDVVKRVMTLRESLKGRNTKIALVLIQKNIPLPGSENIEATEKAAELCSICELSVKSLFALPHTDHLHGYTMRMEGAFCELAQNYYQQESKRIKNNRDNLNKTTQQLLFVRYQFKMAFYHELKQDLLQAVKNYKQAYANLMEVRATDTNMVEVKTVGGFINYKICSLSFILNKPLDSISQFRKHMDIFRSKIGFPEVAFEHSAWMAKQYSHFGDLFEEAVKQGLTAIQTQHPGFYYQQAANCAVNRKLVCHKLCKDAIHYPTPDPLINALSMEYYGQRPWRAGVQSMEPPDLASEKHGLLALQYREREVNHSNVIIGHLRNAVTQFKKYKCPRMKRQLLVQMGEEYHYSQENPKALALLSHVLWDYRMEKWCPLVSNILLTALKCAYLSANIQEYVSLGLEAIGSWILCSVEEKVLIQSNVNNIILGNGPSPMANFNQDEIQTTSELWKETLAENKGKSCLFTIPMTNVFPFVECKAVFTSKAFRADENVTLKVYLRINSPQPMKFTKLSVIFENSIYNPFCEIPSQKQMIGENGNLYLIPNKTRMFTFSFLPSASDVNGIIQISSVALQLGSEDSICAILVWANSGKDPSQTSFGLTCEFPSSRNNGISDDVNFQELCEETSTRVVARDPRLSVQYSHQLPVLKGEFFPLHVSIQSEERNVLTNLNVSLSIDPMIENKDISDNTVFCDEFPEQTTVLFPSLNNIDLGQLTPGCTVERCFYMRSSTVHRRDIKIVISYLTDVDVEEQILHCQCSKDEFLCLDVKEPFVFAPYLLNTKFQAIQVVRSEEYFLLGLDIKSISEVKLALNGGVINLSKSVTSTEDLSSQVAGLELQQDEVSTECFCICSEQIANEPIPLGTYTLTWKRQNSQYPVPWVNQLVELPSVIVASVPLYAELDAPAHGWVRTPMTISYTLYNRSTTVQELALVVDSSEAFMYSGNKQLHFWILPRNSYKLVYNLYPLVSGHVQLPKLRLLMNPGKSTAVSLDDHLQELLPTHIFIMPQGKEAVPATENIRSA